MPDAPPIVGRHVRLEPLERRHLAGLAAASAGAGDLYRWSLVPRGPEEVERYLEAALAARAAGSAVPFATLRLADGQVIGSSRFFDVEAWAWPPGHPRHRRGLPDGTEIGYSWLAPAAVRTGANTEAKLLMLTHAFEAWGVLRVCFHTDVRNQRSRAALERIGARPEGILRAHRLAADATPRDSARYAIVADEWPAVKERLRRLLDRPA